MIGAKPSPQYIESARTTVWYCRIYLYCGFYEIRIITRDLDHINKSSSDLAEIYRDLTYGQTPTTHEITAQ